MWNLNHTSQIIFIFLFLKLFDYERFVIENINISYKWYIAFY